MQRFEASKVKMQEWFQTVRDNVGRCRGHFGIVLGGFATLYSVPLQRPY